MPLFICAVIAAAILTSLLFYQISRRIGLCGKTLIAAITAMNVLFCAVFPPLFALLSGGGRNGPPRGLAPVIAALAAWTALYAAFIVWRIVLRSPGVNLNVPIPEAFFANNVKNAGIYANSAEKPVDSAQNIDKMGIITEPPRNSKSSELTRLVGYAFDCMNGGKPEKAAEYFYKAITLRPPADLEIEIAIQLSVIYSDLGQPELALDILSSYDKRRRGRSTGADFTPLETAMEIVKTAIANNGGDGYEKN